MNQRRLPLQTAVVRFCIQTLLDRLADTLPHLCRRCFCKRYNQHPVNIDGMLLIQYLLHDPLDKNRRLS